MKEDGDDRHRTTHPPAAEAYADAPTTIRQGRRKRIRNKKNKEKQQRQQQHVNSDDEVNDDKTTRMAAVDEAHHHDQEQHGRRLNAEDYDPDGTVHIARGGSGNLSSERRAELAAGVAESPIARRILRGENDAREERREILAKDDALDAKTNDSKLNEKQKHALRKRQKTGGGDKQLSAKMARHERKRLESALRTSQAIEIQQTSRAGWLETESEMERTSAVSQQYLKNHLDGDSARNIFDLKLPKEYGPYGMEYDRSGRCACLYGGGQGGHLALIDNHLQSLKTEFYVHELVRDATFLHNWSLFAVAQKNQVYVYDDQGTEIHCLGSKHQDVMALQYLPYHWLLATIGRPGILSYQDVSTGQLVASHRTKLGPCSVMRQNPSNAVLHCGHQNGTVTLWSPSNSQPLVKLLAHKGAPITAMANDLTGQYMVTGAADRQIRVWDLRTYRELHSYYCVRGTTPTSIDISQRGLLAIGHGSHCTVWPDSALAHKAKSPYMHHLIPASGPVRSVRFRPYEDVCGIGHALGISSMVVPGAGEPELDSHELYGLSNPYADRKQRREGEVRALLEKLQPEMITLTHAGSTTIVGGIEESSPHARLERIRDQQEAAQPPRKRRQKTKKRGRSKIQTKLRRKRANIIDQQTLKLREAREQEKQARQQTSPEKKKNGDDGSTLALLAEPTETESAIKELAPAALKRFF